MTLLRTMVVRPVTGSEPTSILRVAFQVMKTGCSMVSTKLGESAWRRHCRDKKAWADAHLALAQQPRQCSRQGLQSFKIHHGGVHHDDIEAIALNAR